MSAKLRIPESYNASLAKFAQLEPKTLAAFLAAIREQEPTLALTSLTDSIAHQLSIDRGRMGEIVRLLAGLQRVREGFGLSVADFVSELRAAIETSGNKELCPPDWGVFQDAITEALSGESALAISSKALEIREEHSHVYCSARVLTDLRPIFKSDVSSEPAAFVIIHTLKIGYHESDEHKEVYFALDRKDVERLSSLLERALKKEEALLDLAARKDIRVLEVKS